MFIKNIWYVATWSTDVVKNKPFGCVVAGEPIVFWRDRQGELKALQNHCPHRHADLSLGRIEGDDIRCMYHGLKFGADGACKHIPGTDVRPPNANARVYPVVEKDGWIWVWPGDPMLADPALTPDAFGLDVAGCVFKTGGIDYDADYQLVNDNLTDLSHVDFVHETTLKAAGGVSSSAEMPTITKLENGLRFTRWFPPIKDGPVKGLEMWNEIDYLLPGIFLMNMEFHPPGSADAYNREKPSGTPLLLRCEQQAVTPTIAGKCRYVFATGAPGLDENGGEGVASTEQFFEVAMAAFAEDKEMIEAQQKIWNITPDDAPKAFIPQDKGPIMFRKMIAAKLKEEQDLSAKF